MAKVMVSMPDELLADIDRTAEQRGTTRSGYLRALAEQDLGDAARRRAERIAEIRRTGPARTGHGGNAAEQVKAHRPD